MLHSELPISSFENTRVLAIVGVLDYLENRGATVGDRYGQHHGAMGKMRAHNLGVLLSQLNENFQYKNANILAILLAVFTNTIPSSGSIFRNPFRNIGRSSKLASLIADRLIEGDIDYRATPPGSVTSRVFSPNALSNATRNRDNDRSVASEVSGYSYFDKTKGVREILLNTLKSPMFQNERLVIIESLPKLRNYLECNNENVWLRAKLELPFPIGEEDGATYALRNKNLL